MGHDHCGDQNVSDPNNNKECTLINSNQSAFLFKSKRDKSPQHFLAMNHPESMEHKNMFLQNNTFSILVKNQVKVEPNRSNHPSQSALERRSASLAQKLGN